MTERELFQVRIALIQAFLADNGLDGVLLSRIDNFAMATGGKRNYVSLGGDMGANALFVARDGKTYFVGNNIEATRQMAEELGTLGCEPIEFLWFENTPAGVAGARFPGNLASDDGSLGQNVNGKLAVLRSLLTPTELDKYRRLGTLSAEAMVATLEAVEPNMAESDIAAKLIAEGAKRGCFVPVCLVAADERIAKFRHPLPTRAPLVTGSLGKKRVKDYVMIAGGFVREGLVVSMTRFAKVGAVSDATADAYDRICGVDALMQEATQPGQTLGDVFTVCQQAYAELGFPETEWHNHHQGGTTGYAGRTCKGAPGESFPIGDTDWSLRVKAVAGIEVQFGQAFAWNPSAKGVKSEDTFILLPDGRQEIVTPTPSLGRVDLAAVLGKETKVVKSAMAIKGED